MKKNFSPFKTLILVAAGVLAFVGQSAKAQTGTLNTWTDNMAAGTGGNGAWSTANNWSLSAVPGTSTDVIIPATTSTDTITLSSGETAQGIYFDNTTAGSGITGGSLKLGADGLNIMAGAVNPSIESAISLEANQTWTQASTNGSIQEGGGFAADSTVSGTVTLTIDNTGSGSFDWKSAIVDNGASSPVAVVFDITSGGLTLDAGSRATNTGGDTLQAGTITIKSGGASSVSNPLGLGSLTFGTGSTAANEIYVNSAGTYTFANSSVTLDTGDTTTIYNNQAAGTSIAFTGNITGAGALVIYNNSTGNIILSGASSNYTGGTTLTGGIFDINSSSAIGTGTLTLTGGTVDNTSTSAITLTTNNPVVLNGNFSFGSATATSADNINFGTGAVSIAASRTITFTTGGTGETMTFGGTLTNTASGNTAPTITVNSATGGDTLSFANFVLGSNNTSAINDTVNGSANVNITGAISNGTSFANGVTYSGTGTFTLGGTSSYTGTTTLTGGTTVLTGNISTSTVENLAASTPAANATLTGTGTFGPLTLNSGASFGGTIAPGNAGTATGVLHGTSLTWNGGAVGGLTFVLSNTDTTSDELTLSGVFTKGSGSAFDINISGGVAGDTYDLVNFASTTFIAGNFTDTGSTSGTFSIVGGDQLDFTVGAVPEPSTWALLAFGLLSLGGFHFRRYWMARLA